jgi:hypothetical protein
MRQSPVREDREIQTSKTRFASCNGALDETYFASKGSDMTCNSWQRAPTHIGEYNHTVNLIGKTRV